MSRTLLGTLAALAVAALVAVGREEVVRNGVLSGAVLAAGLGLLAALWLSHVARTRPGKAMQALVEGFLAVLTSMLAFTLLLRYVPAVAELLSWKGFLVAYSAVVFVPLVLGAFDGARVLTRGTAS